MQQIFGIRFHTSNIVNGIMDHYAVNCIMDYYAVNGIMDYYAVNGIMDYYAVYIWYNGLLCCIYRIMDYYAVVHCGMDHIML